MKVSAQADGSDSKEMINIDLASEIEDNPELKKDSKLKKAVSTVWKAASGIFKKTVGTKVGDLIDEMLLGQFKDALLEIYKKEKLDSLDEDGLKAELEELQKDSSFKQGTEKTALSSRKDDNESTDVDEKSCKYQAIWISKDKEQNVAKILSDVVADIQKQAQKLQEEHKQLVKTLKSMKIKGLTDDDISNFGPALKQLVDQKKSAEEIAVQLEKLRKEVKESFNATLQKMMNRAKMLNESFMLTEETMQKAQICALLESKTFQGLLLQKMVNEGFFSALGDLAKKAGSAMADASAKAVKTVTSKAFAGALSLGGLAIGIFTGGLAAELVLKGIYAVERHGKALANAFERQYKRFANSKGVFAKMDFKIDGQEKSSYSMRFYSKDMVWRVLNTADQLKQPSLKYSKAIVDGSQGKKFRDQLKTKWDPLFSKAKGGKIDFVALIEQVKDMKVPDQQLKLYKDFLDNYDTIVAACCTSPKIDTRTQSLKKDKS